MTDGVAPTRLPVRGPLAALWSQRHFIVAAGLLAAVTIGWNWTVTQLRWATHKEAVPWPAGVKVDPNCRLTSLPDSLGPFVMAGDGELERTLDGRPDGEVALSPEDLESLKINTALDQMRLGHRASNWYLARHYRDTRAASPGSPFRYWRLEIFYYTGGLDKVPHVPERCLVAGGATLLPSASGKLPVTVPATDAAWQKVNFNRTAYEMSSDRLGLDLKRYAQYYLFSLNGRPESSWEMVRLELTKPWVRYCYFAKIQVAPLGEVTDFDQADKAAAEFIDAIMPAVLPMLPTEVEVQRLTKADVPDSTVPQ